MFHGSFFTDNRRHLREATPDVPIVITAHGLLQRSADAAFTFRQDSSFWYLTGVNEPDAVLVCDKDKEYLIVTAREGVRAAFDGAVDYDTIRKISGISTLYNPEEGWKLLGERLAQVKQVATLVSPPAYIDFYGMYTNPARAALVKRIKKHNKHIELIDLRERMAGMRRVKQEAEIAAITRAIAITIEGLERVGFNLKNYAYEFEVEAELTSYFRKQNAMHAFDPIIAGGRNACTLHYLANNAPLHAGDLLMFDVGAGYEQYAADISRTFAAAEPSKRQLAVHRAVCAVQDYALSLLKPGMLVIEYEKKIEKFMGEQLKELGLVKTADKESIRRYFPHATSHHLGIDVHDVGAYDEPLVPNVVLTCEPGIYIPEEGIGVRIEDDILITENGNENLSARLSRDLG